MKKYGIIALVIGALLATILFVSNGSKNNVAKNEYKAAQVRCGRDNPIVISPRHVSFSGDVNGIEVYAGPNVPDPGEKYYCTLTEAANDGYDRQTLNREASEEIKRLYP
jgi:hypothetical protein